MHAEIAHQILLRLALPIPMPSSVDNQNVAGLNLDRSGLEHCWRDDCPVVHVLRNIDHCTRSDQKIQWIGRHVTHAIGAMHSTIDMSTNMQGCVDALRHN